MEKENRLAGRVSDKHFHESHNLSQVWPYKLRKFKGDIDKIQKPETQNYLKFLKSIIKKRVLWLWWLKKRKVSYLEGKRYIKTVIASYKK